MHYVIAAYIVILGGIAFYWWSLSSRREGLARQLPPDRK